jgi:U3 small nucleolar RNA-associated protein 21
LHSRTPHTQAAIDLSQHDLQEPTCCVHPDTYVNKVLLGGADGSLQLWNFATQERIYTFKGW